MVEATQPSTNADLSRWLERTESLGQQTAGVLPFGIANVDARVPSGCFQRGHLHKVIEGGPTGEFLVIATLFTAGIVARIPGPVLWCLRGRDLFAPALASFSDACTKFLKAASPRNMRALRHSSRRELSRAFLAAAARPAMGRLGPYREPKPINKPRDAYTPDLHIDALKLKTRSFR